MKKSEQVREKIKVNHLYSYRQIEHGEFIIYLYDRHPDYFCKTEADALAYIAEAMKQFEV